MDTGIRPNKEAAMLKTEHGPDRSRLGFREAVLANFSFLEDKGLKPVQQDVTFVRYESDGVFVDVYHGRVSFELGVEIGRLAEPTKKYGLLRMAQTLAPKQEVPSGGAAREPDLLRRLIGRLAQQTRKYATPFLSGDAELFHRLDEVEQARSNEYWNE